MSCVCTSCSPEEDLPSPPACLLTTDPAIILVLPGFTITFRYGVHLSCGSDKKTGSEVRGEAPSGTVGSAFSFPK